MIYTEANKNEGVVQVKTRITALLITLTAIILLSACSAGTHSDLEVSGKPDLPYSFSESKSSESNSTLESTSVSEISKPTTELHSNAEESDTSIQALTASESASGSSTQEQPQTKPGSTAQLQVVFSDKQTPTETTQQKPTPTTPKPTEDPTLESTPEPIQQPSFDIGYWVSYAKSYAQSKGLSLDSSATECWDNPISAGANCTSTERNIISRINRYAKDEDITDVWIWAESTGNGNYDLYIGYA